MLVAGGLSCKLAKLCLITSTIISLITGVIAITAGNVIYFTLDIGTIPSTLLSISISIIVGLLIVTWRFYRDPERVIPQEEHIVVSPADGKVCYIRYFTGGIVPDSIKGRTNLHVSELTKSNIGSNKGYLIGIIMTILDVHVNRSPIDGKVIFQKHTNGAFWSLKSINSDVQNERNTIVIENDLLQIPVIQIASKQVRRVISYVKQGDVMKRGDRIGKIVFGSQVDILLPDNESLEILIRENEQVYAGQSILARWRQVTPKGVIE